MAASDKVSLDFTGDSLVNFVVDQGAVDAAVVNSGTISADGGLVVMTAKTADELIASVVNNDGVVEARTLEAKEGRIILDADNGQTTLSGTLDVSSLDGKAGKIVVTGDRVFVEAETSLKASGANGGGEIFVGGGWQGSDTSIHNATETVVKQGAVLEASAIDNGNGGTVVVWSDKNTYFSGSIFATGGEYGGDGGQVEVSGKENLGFYGNVDVLSSNGMNGSLLLDPQNITIVDGSAGQTGIYADWSVNDNDNASYVIPETVLEALTGNVELTAYNNIIMNDLTDNILNLSATSISFFSNDEQGDSSQGGLTMDVSDTIKLNGTGNLTLQGGSQAGPSNAYSIYAGSLWTNGGDVIFNTKRSSDALPIRVLGTITTNGGNVSVAAGTRFGLTNSENVDVQLDGLVSTSGGNFSSNMIGTVEINGGMNLGAGSASFGGTGTQINSVITSTANVTIASPLTFGTGSGITTTGTVTFNQTASMASAGADLTLTASNFVFNNTFTGNSGNITLKPYNVSTNVDIGSHDTGDMTISSANFSQLSGFGNVTVGRDDGTGTTNVVSDTTMSASGHLELINQTVNVTGGTLANTGGDIILTGDTFNITKGITANSGNGKITLRQQTTANSLNFGTGITDAIADLMSANTLEIGRTNGGNIIFDGDISTTASTVNVLSGGNITFSTGQTLDVGTGIVNLVAGGNFINNSGASAISTSGDGRWLIWSSNPANDTRGGLAYDFKQYNATYGSTAVAGGAAEDGFLYTLAPTITASLTGTVSKTYDATIAATLVAGNYTTSGAIDSDIVSLNNPTSGTYDTKNVGSSKTVTATGVSISSVANGTADVYGYQLASTTAAGAVGTITAANLATTGAAAQDKVYDATTAATITGETLVGVLLSDTVTVSGDGTFADKTVGTSKVVTAALSIAGTDSGNYSLTQPTSLTADITKADLAVTGLTTSNKVYDATPTAPLGGTAAITKLGTDDVAIGGTAAGAFADKNVAAGKAVTVTGNTISGTDAGNYTLVQQTGLTADITQATLTTTGAAAQNKVYDATTAATITGETLVGVLLSDTVTVSGDGTFADKTVGTSKVVTAALSIAGTDSGNYSLTQPTSLTADITKADLAVTGLTVSNKVYDATVTAALGGTAAITKLGTDNVAIGGTAAGAFADKNVAAGKAVTVTGNTISGTDAGNYTLVQQTGLTADITQATLTTTGAAAQNKVYDATTAATITGETLVGVLLSDTVTVSGDGTFADKTVGTSKVVTAALSIAGTDSGNYSLTQPTSLTADITKADLAVTGLTVSNKVYDATVTAALGGTAAITKLGTDDVAIGGTAAGAFADKNVAAGKAVTVTGNTISGTDAGNYTLVQQTGLTADITQATLTTTGAAAQDKVYDATTAATITGETLVGVLLSDTVTVSGGGTFADKTVGTSKVVTAALSIAGTDSGNYALTQPTSLTADITKADLAVTGLTASNKVYDATVTAALGGTAAITKLGTDDVAIGGTAAGAFADKNVAAGKAVTVTGNTISGTDAGNYTLVQQTGLTADITQATLTTTGAAAQNKVYDATTAATITGETLVGVLLSDTVTVSGDGTFADKTVGTSKVVTAALSIAGTDSGNYSLTQPTSLTADITKADLAVTGLTVSNKVYDATVTAALGGTAAITKLGTDNVAIGGTAAGAFADKNVAAGKAVTVTGNTISGTDAGNYTLLQQTGLTADITQATLTTTGAAAQNKVYDATTAATITGETLVGVLLSDTVTVSGDGTFADKTVGTSKVVTAALSIAGTDSGNYSLTQPTSLTADITKADLAVTGLTVSNKVYDATVTAALGGTAAITKLGTDDVAIGGTAAGAFADKNVAAGKAVTVTGNTISGTDAGNYTLLQQTGLTANITPKEINATDITADDKSYDGTTDAALNTAGAGLSGVIVGDTTALGTTFAAGFFIDPNVGQNKTVNVTGLALSGTDADNYTLAAYNTTASITGLTMPASLLSLQRSINGTQLDQSSGIGTPITFAIGPGGGSITLASFVTSTLVSDFSQAGGNQILTSTNFTAPVIFTETGSTSTMILGGSMLSGTLVEVGTLTVFTQRGGIPVVQGSFVVQESPSSLSLTRTTFSGTVQEIGSPAPADQVVPFTLSMPNGMTLNMTSSVTDKGFLVITVLDSGGTIDLSHVVLMGLMIMKNEQNTDIEKLKGVLLNQR